MARYFFACERCQAAGGQDDDGRSQPDPARPLRERPHEDVRRREDAALALEVVLVRPDLVEAELLSVQRVVDQPEQLVGVGAVVLWKVGRLEDDPELHVCLCLWIRGQRSGVEIHIDWGQRLKSVPTEVRG